MSAGKNGDDTTALYKDGDELQYGFTLTYGKSGVTQILARLDPGAAQALSPNAAPEPVLHGGTSFDDAIVLKAPSEAVGVKSEYAYLAVHPCAGSGRWQPKHQALQKQRDVPYDVLTVTCTSDNSQRDFYFNIAGYFGKM